LYVNSSQKILGQTHAAMKSLWEHSFRAAYYAFLLARGLKRQREILDNAYVAGLLHDLGTIIITSLHPETHEKMRRFSVEKNILPGILESFSFGMNHADIGALIAQKWNFPEQLVEGIKYHHDPLSASHKCKDVVFCVYLANAVCDLERGLISYEQLEKPVLGDFKIQTKEQFLGVASNLKSTFEKRHEELSGH
jgi:putative nucleotidyltransferase with HDIG domain